MSLLSRLPPRSNVSRGSSGGTRAGLSGCNVLLCITGSVASVHTASLYRALLSRLNVSNVVVVLTPSAKRFICEPPLPDSATVFEDEADWSTWNSLGDPVLHIALQNWADALVVAPLSANTLAKLAGGLCDNLVTRVARAWPVGTKPFVVAPAMSSAMWTHPITGVQLQSLQTPAFGMTVVQPVEKTIANEVIGMRDMASPDDIASVLSELLLRLNPPNNPPFILQTGEDRRDELEPVGLRVQPGPSIVQTDGGQSIVWPPPWQWSSPAQLQQAPRASFVTPQTPSPPAQFHPPLPVELERPATSESRRRHCRKISCPNPRDQCPGRWPRGKCPSEYK